MNNSQKNNRISEMFSKSKKLNLPKINSFQYLIRYIIDFLMTYPKFLKSAIFMR